MKRILIALAFVFALGITSQAASQKHRHHQNVTMTIDKDSAKIGITAYSDTTDTEGVNEDSTNNATSYSSGWDSNNSGNSFIDDGPGGFMLSLLKMGGSGGILAFLIMLMLILAILSPAIIIGVILYFIFRNRNQRYKLYEKALNEGRPIPENAMPQSKQTSEYMWARGIKNASIGVGVSILLYMLGMEALAGIGFLIACLGIGQAIIAKTTNKNRDSQQSFNSDSTQYRHGNNNTNNNFTETKQQKPVNTPNEQSAEEPAQEETRENDVVTGEESTDNKD